MKYKKTFFDPPEGQDLDPAGDIETDPQETSPVYVYTEKIKLAVNVAFAADRPLLVTGPPGSGKSTLAVNIAVVKGWRFLPEVVTSRTRAEDILGRFDSVRRLSDATSQDSVLPDEAYIEPGVLWCGSDDGLVHVSRDDGATWTDVTPEGLPEWTQINSIEAHPFAPGGLYVADAPTNAPATGTSHPRL